MTPGESSANVSFFVCFWFSVALTDQGDRHRLLTAVRFCVFLSQLVDTDEGRDVVDMSEGVQWHRQLP
jgi:hypothetical protein